MPKNQPNLAIDLIARRSRGVDRGRPHHIHQHQHAGQGHPEVILGELSYRIQVRIVNAAFQAVGAGNGDGGDGEAEGDHGKERGQDG